MNVRMMVALLSALGFVCGSLGTASASENMDAEGLSPERLAAARALAANINNTLWKFGCDRSKGEGKPKFVWEDQIGFDKSGSIVLSNSYSGKWSVAGVNVVKWTMADGEFLTLYFAKDAPEFKFTSWEGFSCRGIRGALKD